MPRSGITVGTCMECESETVHSVVLVGTEAYYCCNRCKAVRIEDELDVLPVLNEMAPPGYWRSD